MEPGQERALRECSVDTGRPLGPGPVVGGGGVTMEEANAMGTPRQPAIISPKTMTGPKVEMKVLAVLAVLIIIHPRNMETLQWRERS